MNVLARLAAAAALAFVAAEAGAAACSASTTSVNFGAYDVFASGNDDTTGTIVVTCSKDAGDPNGNITVVYDIALGAGNSGNILARFMSSGSDQLNYNLYTTSARSTVWGDGVTGSSAGGNFTLTNGNPSRSRQHVVFGRIPPLQDAAVGALYTDNVPVTINF